MNKNFCFLFIMKTTRMKLLACFFATLFLLSCSKDASENTKQDCNSQPSSALIKGEWEWISSTSFYPPPQIFKPAAGNTMQLKFTDDSEYVYKNDVLQYSLFYALKYQKDVSQPGDSTLMLSTGNGNLSLFKVTCDTLTIDNSYADNGTLDVYSRK